MHKLLLKLEPVIWLLFGQGILIGTMLLTPFLLVVCLGVPMGFVDADALSYARIHGIATYMLLGFIPLGQLILAALLILPLWKGAHHVRSLLIDLGGGDRDAVIGSALYAIATVGSVIALIAIVAL